MYKDNLRKKKDDSFIIKNYENNLKISYEAIRKDYDISMTSIIPTQKNLIRTYMWLTLLLLGFCFTMAKDTGGFWHFLTISITSISCIASVFAFLIALYYRKPKQVVNICIDEIAGIKDDEYSHSQGLINLIEKTQIAYNENTKIIEFRAKYIRIATVILFIATAFFTASILITSYTALCKFM